MHRLSGGTHASSSFERLSQFFQSTACRTRSRGRCWAAITTALSTHVLLTEIVKVKRCRLCSQCEQMDMGELSKVCFSQLRFWERLAGAWPAEAARVTVWPKFNWSAMKTAQDFVFIRSRAACVACKCVQLITSYELLVDFVPSEIRPLRRKSNFFVDNLRSAPHRCCPVFCFWLSIYLPVLLLRLQSGRSVLAIALLKLDCETSTVWWVASLIRVI